MSNTPAEDLKGATAVAGALVVVLAPATGAIVARSLGQPLWYGLVWGGWVCMGLATITARRMAKTIRAQTEATKSVADIATEMRSTLDRLKTYEAGVHTTDPTVPPRDWVREPPNPY